MLPTVVIPSHDPEHDEDSKANGRLNRVQPKEMNEIKNKNTMFLFELHDCIKHNPKSVLECYGKWKQHHQQQKNTTSV